MKKPKKMTSVTKILLALEVKPASTGMLTFLTGLSQKTVSARLVELFRMGAVVATGAFTRRGNIWRVVGGNRGVFKGPPRRPARLKEPKSTRIEPLGPKDGGYPL